MLRTLFVCVSLQLVAATAVADDAAQAPQKPAAKPAPHAQKVAEAKKEAPAGGDVKMSGMSVLGNDDSPKSLVIVPWKSSQLGDMPGLSKMLDDSTQPLDKEVFMRELSYYQIKVESK
jgi:hypothetical protein